MRLGRRKEETRAHLLSTRLLLPTASTTLSMMSCGIATELATIGSCDVAMKRLKSVVNFLWFSSRNDNLIISLGKS